MSIRMLGYSFTCFLIDRFKWFRYSKEPGQIYSSINIHVLWFRLIFAKYCCTRNKNLVLDIGDYSIRLKINNRFKFFEYKSQSEFMSKILDENKVFSIESRYIVVLGIKLHIDWFKHHGDYINDNKGEIK
jgi:hypothetical protein